MPAVQRGIRFENVTFRYPGSERATLENFNLEVPAGRVTAILGANGSGKSTVLKLLCRLYDPEAGRVTRVPSGHPEGYATVTENIAMSDLQGAPTADQITAAAKAAGAEEVIARLPAGYDSLLGKTLESGTELSGGEWQRIALARAFLRPSPILLLDEPTSAMDSWGEADWMVRLRQLAQGRTAVIITHRLSIAMRSDSIFVMEQGRVVESGSHAELLRAGTRYATAWASQTIPAS